MNISVSNLCFPGLMTHTMRHLPNNVGVEIFCEIGSDYYWDNLLPLLLRGREVPLSVHGPFQWLDLADSEKDFAPMLEAYIRAFKLCRKYGAKDCVCHPYDGGRPADDTPERLEAAKQCSLERILVLNEIAKQYGVTLLVENMPEKNGMLGQKAFIELFAPHNELNFLIDTGHAKLLDWDMDYAFRTLGDRIKAYHVHDNFGDADSHMIVGTGKFDWDGFFKGFVEYTPNAAIVCEYNTGYSMDEVMRSIEWIHERIAAAE